ncbi:hypothetical protein HYZ98_02135 [Candidatus Peregrinibacteria bacterium]|nr:hypothetical protein [Candidatus Peregrinibacteria bacterium]
MFAHLLQYIGPSIAHAQIITDTISGCNFRTGKLTAACIPLFIGHVIQVIIGLIGGFLAVNIIIAGYQIAIANVIDDKAAGKNRLVWSLVGFTVCVSCYFIVDIILDMFLSGTFSPN